MQQQPPRGITEVPETPPVGWMPPTSQQMAPIPQVSQQLGEPEPQPTPAMSVAETALVPPPLPDPPVVSSAASSGSQLQQAVQDPDRLDGDRVSGALLRKRHRP